MEAYTQFVCKTFAKSQFLNHFADVDTIYTDLLNKLTKIFNKIYWRFQSSFRKKLVFLHITDEISTAFGGLFAEMIFIDLEQVFDINDH